MRKYITKLNLTEEEHAALEEAYRNTTNRRIAQRIQCVLLKAQGKRAREIKRVVLLSENQISHWVRTYVLEGLEGLLKWRYSGKPCGLEPSEKAQLTQALEDLLFSTSKEVKRYISENFKKEYTIRAIQYLLKRLGYSFKKTKRLPGKEPDLKAQEAFKKSYFELREDLEENEDIFFLDGLFLLHNSMPDYAWIRRGKDRWIKSNTGRKRVNLLGAYSPLSTSAQIISTTERCNSDTVIELLKRILDLSPMASRIFVFLDNIPYQRARKVKEFVENTIIELIYLPPYSPNLNLIERLWDYLKDILVRNHYHETFECFCSAISNTLNSLDDRKEEWLSRMTENFQILNCV